MLRCNSAPIPSWLAPFYAQMHMAMWDTYFHYCLLSTVLSAALWYKFSCFSVVSGLFYFHMPMHWHNAAMCGVQTLKAKLLKNLYFPWNKKTMYSITYWPLSFAKHCILLFYFIFFFTNPAFEAGLSIHYPFISTNTACVFAEELQTNPLFYKLSHHCCLLWYLIFIRL